MGLWAVLSAALFLVSAPRPPPLPWLMRAPTAPARVLVGDWESPTEVVLVYGDDWLETYQTLLDELALVVNVTVLIEEGQSLAEVEADLAELEAPRRDRVWLTGYEVDSSWPRDYGPLQVRERDGAITWLDTPYAATRPKDDSLPEHLAKWYGGHLEEFELSIDGGGIASNGRGLCVSTEEYFELVSIDMTDQPMMLSLLRRLGCKGLVFVPSLAHEGTKHVDLVMQFLSPTLVVVARFDPTQAPEDARRTDRAAQRLATAALLMDVPLRIERIDSPPPRGEVYPSYINFLQVEGMALVPTYESVDISVDRKAVARLAELMPDRVVIPIPSDEVLPHGGAVHCLTWGMLRG